MGKRKPITIGQFTFAGRSERLAFIRAIIDSTQNEQPLTGEKAEFVSALLQMHPKYAERVANRKILHFTVSTAEGGSRCFYIVFEEGKMQHFSHKKCF